MVVGRHRLGVPPEKKRCDDGPGASPAELARRLSCVDLPKQMHLDLAAPDLDAAEAEALRLGAIKPDEIGRGVDLDV